MTENSKVISEMAQPVHITLTKNAKGSYQWEISIHSNDPRAALRDVMFSNAELTKQYGESKSEIHEPQTLGENFKGVKA